MAASGPIPSRPLVVLVGWLGCQPSNLRRYQRLHQNALLVQSSNSNNDKKNTYDMNGTDHQPVVRVMTRIAPPPMMIHDILTRRSPAPWIQYKQQQQHRVTVAAVTDTVSIPSRSASGWTEDSQNHIHYHDNIRNREHKSRHNLRDDEDLYSFRPTRVSTMNDFVWELIHDIHQSACTHCIFHVFSNGGCVVWDHIRRIIDDNDGMDHNGGNVDPTLVRRDVDVLSDHARSWLRNALVGVIFDSCPGGDFTKLQQAMMACSWTDFLKIFHAIGPIHMANMLWLQTPSTMQHLKKLGDEFIQTLTFDPWSLPQLYLYSANDVLAPSELLDALIDQRQAMHGKNNIWRQRWESSKHCQHLLQHPTEYEAAVQMFSLRCFRGSRHLSRL